MAMKSILRPAKCLSTTLRCYSSTPKLISVKMNEKSGIATVSMDRQPLNGLNYEFLKELDDILHDLENTNARGVILTSSLKTVFTAGLDIMELYKPDPDKVKALCSQLQDTWMTLYSTPYPTVAAITGHAPGGGCLFGLCCEYRIMVDNYKIGMNETQLGIVPPFWVISAMKNTISVRNTELALTPGRFFSTQEALKIGLIDEIAADRDEAITKAEAFFKRFAKINPLARQLTKTSLRHKDVDELRKKKQQDVDEFFSVVTHPKVQKELKVYLESLKKKSG